MLRAASPGITVRAIVASVGYLAVALSFIIPFRSIIRLRRPRPPRL